MKKILILGVMLVFFATLIGFAFQDRSRDMPPGVQPERWIRLAENVGIVVEEARGFVLAPGVKGSLMIKLGRDWQPLYLASNLIPRVEPAQK